MSETHLTYCKNAAISIIEEIDANPDLLDDPPMIFDRIESASYSPHPRLTIEHAFDRICKEMIDLRPELADPLR